MKPRLMMDLSSLWEKPGKVYVGFDFLFRHNKYGIAGLTDRVILPLVIWVL